MGTPSIASRWVLATMDPMCDTEALVFMIPSLRRGVTYHGAFEDCVCDVSMVR